MTRAKKTKSTVKTISLSVLTQKIPVMRRAADAKIINGPFTVERNGLF
jgi:hypothetical protein